MDIYETRPYKAENDKINNNDNNKRKKSVILPTIPVCSSYATSVTLKFKLK